MAVPFYPNKCYVCDKTSPLKRCSRCQLISYCGETHQKSDWDLHKEFCSVISKITKAKQLSHIYEDLRGCSLQEWINARNSAMQHVVLKLGRHLQKRETEMLEFPRSCITCYDTKQDNLTNCPRCPLVSFCKDHPNSSHHDKICSQIQSSYDWEMKICKDPLSYSASLFTIMNCLPTRNFNLIPNSMAEFVDPLFNGNKELNDLASMLFCVPLTIVSTLQKLNCISLSKMTILMTGIKDINSGSSWEILFHFFPNLTFLKIVVTDCNAASSSEPKLCSHCSSKRKRLVITVSEISCENYVFQDKHQTPNLVVFNGLIPVAKKDHRYLLWKEMSDIWPRLNCPLVIMSDTDKRAQRLRETFNTPFWKPLICFEGSNSFAATFGIKDWEEYEIAKLCQYMIITKAPNGVGKSMSVSQFNPKKVEENVPQGERNVKNSFYSGICHVCKSYDALVPCKRCKMIFYCGSKHAQLDWSSHKDICKVIVGLLNEKRTTYLFDNLKTATVQQRKKAKYSFMEKTEKKLKRELMDFEKQMFLFPRTCVVCHESDLSVLKNCKCGISLCKIHRDDAHHKTLCKEYILDMMMNVYKVPRVTIAIMPVLSKGTTLPASMEVYMTSYLILNSEPKKLFVKDSDKVMISDYFSGPLTFIYAIQKLKYCVPKEMVIHVTGVTEQEIKISMYWQIVPDWLKNLESLQIIFIGVHLPDREDIISNLNGLMTSQKRLLKFKSIRQSYDQYFHSKDFLKPHMFIAYNLDEHNMNNLSYTNCSFPKTLLLVKEMNIPFIMTTTSEERGKKNIKMLTTLLGKINNYEFFEKNPFAGIFPERDFETELINYSNNFIAVYKKFTEGNSTKKINSASDCENCDCRSKLSAGDKNKNSLLKKNAPEIKKHQIKISEFQSKVEKSETPVKINPNKQIKNETTVLKVNSEKSNLQTDNSSEPKKEANLKSEMLLKENLLLQEENKILKENLHLREENKLLKKENSLLNEKLAMLKTKKSLS